ncbi:MAG: Topoisomerase 1-associated factor 1 [Peltula sp. TS41687]|nr:MAG: Topoisomerase 1-associated factor 1 [Peltula sp. TS41687]
MEQTTHLHEVVGQEIQAYVNSLVSALGGTGADENGRYVLGDEALSCLKDLRRWLKAYDEKTNRLDVARCLAESNLVNGDLLEILSLWPEDATEDKARSKIALACLELLVPLTWPLDKDDSQMKVNHHRHLPYIYEAQVSYKRGILNHSNTKILRTLVRIGLPSMALPMDERTSRDEGIIKLILYFLRNIAIISVPPKVEADVDDNGVSRSATLDAFHSQDILHLLLTISSSMGEDFKHEDVIVLDVLYHLLKGIDVETVFMSEKQFDSKNSDELQDLLHKEASMLRSYAKNAPTRHNRFGTMIWIKRDEARVSTVSGQDALKDPQRSLAKIDETKKWKKPKAQLNPKDHTEDDSDIQVALTNSARKHLRTFVEEFLDSAFNPLFHHIHRAIEREADRVLDGHKRQFFYLISWFLRAERARRKAAASRQKQKQDVTELEDDSFALIATVLTQEAFITLNRFMQESYDGREWHDVKAGMRCLTQILLTVQDMSQSPLEEDQTIAENILSRLFYEETTHDRIVTLVRNYSKQDFGYLDACTELAHVHLRMLEQYSKQNVEMQVRSRRKARQKKKKPQAPPNAEGNAETDEQALEHDDASEREEVAEAQTTSKERRFDFTRFAARFMKQGCVNTFFALTRFYTDLTADQLKRCHRFFYRVAFKMEMSVILFRVDIIALLNSMIKGPQCLDPQSSAYREWFELVRQLFKKLVRTIEQRPELVVEMLFSKISATVYYLEHGYEKETANVKPRAPADLEVKPGMELDQQIGIAVSILLSQGKAGAVGWIKRVLSSAIGERESWEKEREARRSAERENGETDGATQEISAELPSIGNHHPFSGQAILSAKLNVVVKQDNEERRLAMFKDNKLRLLMTLVGFQRLSIDDDKDSSWIIPSSITSSNLSESLEMVKQAEVDPPTFEEGKSAEDYIRRKLTPRTRRVEYDDDEEEDGFVDYEDDLKFPPGGPTMCKSDALEDLKKTRNRRTKKDDGNELTEEELQARAKARREAQVKKQQKIKSNLFVHESDEEENEERDRDFFAKEEETRKAQSRRVLEVLRQGRVGKGKDEIEKSIDREVLGRKGKKRKKSNEEEGGQKRRRRRRKTDELSETDDQASSNSSRGSSPDPLLSDDEDITDTPISSPHHQSSQPSRSKRAGSASLMMDDPSAISKILAGDDDTDGDEGEDEGSSAIAVPSTAARVHGGFVVDSDSD